MIRVVIAEDHKIVRQGFKAILDSNRNISVEGETGDGLEAVRLVEELRPDVLIVDLSMPGLDGLEVTRRVKKVAMDTRVVVLSMHADEGYIVSALRSGASGYVLKEDGAECLLEAVEKITDGRRYLSPGLPNEDIGRLVDAPRSNVKDRYDTLSEREREVLQLIAEGFSSPEIAEKIYISPRTVDTHRANIIAKLGLGSISALVRFAVERGLIPPRHGRKQEFDD